MDELQYKRTVTTRWGVFDACAEMREKIAHPRQEHASREKKSLSWTSLDATRLSLDWLIGCYFKQEKKNFQKQKLARTEGCHMGGGFSNRGTVRRRRG